MAGLYHPLFFQQVKGVRLSSYRALDPDLVSPSRPTSSPSVVSVTGRVLASHRGFYLSDIRHHRCPITCPEGPGWSRMSDSMTRQTGSWLSGSRPVAMQSLDTGRGEKSRPRPPHSKPYRFPEFTLHTDQSIHSVLQASPLILPFTPTVFPGVLPMNFSRTLLIFATVVPSFYMGMNVSGIVSHIDRDMYDFALHCLDQRILELDTMPGSTFQSPGGFSAPSPPDPETISVDVDQEFGSFGNDASDQDANDFS